MTRARIIHGPVLVLFTLLLALVIATPASAQNPTGSIAGRVIDSTGLAVPGATVTATSPQLQGSRRAVTSTDGDYILALLPPGRYTVVFSLDRFGTLERTIDVAPTEVVSLNATLQPAGVSEAVTVTGTGNNFVSTIQSATNIKQDLTSQLPTARTLLSAVNLAPAVHLTGPSNGISIAGSMSFENLIMLNGVQIQDNLRGQPFNLFIEDAIQETTISTAGISAEYGRFSGGVVNAITKSGGNEFGGSYRATFNNDNWRTVSPFGEPKKDDTVPTHEYTFGGPIVRDKTWFFFAGRTFDQSAAQQTGFTNLPYVNQVQEDRYEIKVTQSLGTGQSLKGGYTGIRRDEVNNTFPSPNLVMDTRSFVSRQLPQDLVSVHYSGLFGSNLFLEGQYSQRMFAFENDGGTNTDLIEGTLLLDQRTGATWWAPAFCGVCVSEQRDNQNLLFKGNYFLAKGRGAHQLTFGYDWFNDQRQGDNHQSASDWHIWTTASTIVDGEVFPVAIGNGSTWIINWPILSSSQGTDFRTHSLFLNDSWQVSSNLTVNLGLRWDKNQGRDAAGADVVRDSALSPRLGFTWDPRGDGRWSLQASYGRYVAAIANVIADAASPAGTPATFAWFYEGPDINTGGGPLLSSPEAIAAIFDWFNANGGATRDTFFADVPGVATRIGDNLRSPHADEFVVGMSRQLGSRGAVRADFTYRNFSDFYADFIDPTSGTVTDELGRTFDLKNVGNTNRLDRQYAGLSVQSNYRVSNALQLGGTYTLSRLWGNVNGENITSGPLTSSIESYGEFFDPAWSFPDGDLSGDQRHRLRLWALYDVYRSDRWGNVNVSLLQQAESGTPYGAVAAIESGPFAADPGYAQPPATVNYFFTDRDAFHTEAQYRSDVAFNYERAIPGAARARFFARFDVLNLFDQFQLYNLGTGAINTTTLTALDDPSRFQTFNPFTETPVQGVHWDFGDQFGEATGAGAYTLPRTFRFTLGVRF